MRGSMRRLQRRSQIIHKINDNIKWKVVNTKTYQHIQYIGGSDIQQYSR